VLAQKIDTGLPVDSFSAFFVVQNLKLGIIPCGNKKNHATEDQRWKRDLKKVYSLKAVQH